MAKTRALDEENQVPLLAEFTSWKLEDAKARFSELVRSAKEEPQRVTVHGKDSVMVVDAKTFAKLLPASNQPSLHELLSESPLSRLNFDHSKTQAPVREVKL